MTDNNLYLGGAKSWSENARVLEMRGEVRQGAGRDVCVLLHLARVLGENAFRHVRKQGKEARLDHGRVFDASVVFSMSAVVDRAVEGVHDGLHLAM